MNQFILPSQMSRKSRSETFPVYVNSRGKVLCTWGVFWQRVECIQAFIEKSSASRWILASDNVENFTIAMLAVFRANRDLVLPANIQAGAIRAVTNSNSVILVDNIITADSIDSDISEQVVISDVYEQIPSSLPLSSIIQKTTQLFLYTSGSTGEPKEVPKQLQHIEAELQNIFDLWGHKCLGKTFHASVSHRHLYGILFFVLFPLCSGNPVCTEAILYPESLADLYESPLVLIGSPAFYKRLGESELNGSGFSDKGLFFSSGGALDRAVAQKVSSLHVSLYEIYGSTETGGIAWRKAPDEQSWIPFKGISVRSDMDSRIEIVSPYLLSSNWFATGDRGYFDQQDALHFQGRVDMVVKIEEKRISLDEVERRLCESSYIEEARVIAMEEGRQYLAAVIVLSLEGRTWFSSLTKLEANRHFRDWLKVWFEPSVLPRKWRFIEKMPTNSMGKIQKDALVSLFSESNKKTDPEVHSVTFLGKTLVMELSFDPQCLWFQGHFPGTPVLPGVVQFDWLMKTIERYMNLKLRLVLMSRIKFTRPILPSHSVWLEIEISEDEKRLNFRYYNQMEDFNFSSGKLQVERVL